MGITAYHQMTYSNMMLYIVYKIKQFNWLLSSMFTSICVTNFSHILLSNILKNILLILVSCALEIFIFPYAVADAGWCFWWPGEVSQTEHAGEKRKEYLAFFHRY